MIRGRGNLRIRESNLRLEFRAWWPVTAKAVLIRVMDRTARQGARRSHSPVYGDDEQRRIDARGAPGQY